MTQQLAISDYKIRLYNTSGVLQAEIADFGRLAYTKQRNAPGISSFNLPSNHPAVSYFTDKCQVEIWRRNPSMGLDWHADFYGLYREPERRGGVVPGVFTAVAPGQMSMLAWRHVAYKAGTANRSEYSNLPAETVMKSLVTYNATSSATTGAGRIRTGSISGVTIAVEEDNTGGNTVNWSCAWAQLLETLQLLANDAGGDFDLIKTGATSWEFRWYEGQRGTDKSSTVIFSEELGNMGNPIYREKRLGEKTAIIVGGSGEGDFREVVTRTGPNYSATNDIEFFVDARGITTTAGLNARGDAEAQKLRARSEFDFKALQIPSTFYGVHYVLGDLVTTRSPFSGAESSQVVDRVTVTRDVGGESVDVQMKDL